MCHSVLSHISYAVVDASLQRLLLHGEQYLRLARPLATSGCLRSHASILDVLDKGRAAVVVMGIETTDEAGQLVCYNEVTTFVRGSGEAAVQHYCSIRNESYGSVLAAELDPGQDVVPTGVILENIMIYGCCC